MLDQAEALDVLGKDVAPVASLGRRLDIRLDANLLTDDRLSGIYVSHWQKYA